MEKIQLHGDDQAAITKAAAVLLEGGVVVLPTDTVYGLATTIADKASLEKIFALKERPGEKALPILVKDIGQAKDLAEIDEHLEDFLMQVWPGAVTVIFKKKPEVPAWLTAGKETIALRMPDHAFMLDLLAVVNVPIAATSVNRSGQPPMSKVGDIVGFFEKTETKPDLIIDAGDLAESQPSTIIDCTTPNPVILREGAMPNEELLRLYHGTSST